MDWVIGEYITMFYVFLYAGVLVERDFDRNNTILVKTKSVQGIKVSH